MHKPVYHNKYLNSMKCQEISTGPSKCTNQDIGVEVYEPLLEALDQRFCFERYIALVRRFGPVQAGRSFQI
jgi:hypothetical protein